MNKTPEEIIKKNCIFDKSDLRFASVKYYAESGSLSGSLYQAIKDSILEYHAQSTPQVEVREVWLEHDADYWMKEYEILRRSMNMRDAVFEIVKMVSKQTIPASPVASGYTIEQVAGFAEWILRENILPRDVCWFDAGKHYTSSELAHQYLSSIKPVAEGWVSVEDRLPTEKDADENGKVLVWRNTNEGQKGLSKSIFDYFMVKNCDTDTFWQPLPPPPQSIT